MRKLIIAVLGLMVMSCSSLFATITESEKNALRELYSYTNGASWDTWTTKKSWDFTNYENPCPGNLSGESSWGGITCANGHIFEIDLMEDNLEGTLPNSIGDLTYLRKLKLNRNKLSGTIPVVLKKLKNLEHLSLSVNKLTGTIPVELFTLTKLKKVYLYDNKLIGQIPTQIENLKNLEEFWVHTNKLKGTIPSSIKDLKLTSNRAVSFYGNYSLNTQLIPLRNWIDKHSHYKKKYNDILKTNTQYIALKKINTLLADHDWGWNDEDYLDPCDYRFPWNYVSCDSNGTVNDFRPPSPSGSKEYTLSKELMDELIKLDALETIWLTYLNLVGSIPKEFGKMDNLKELWLVNNKLTGTIPKELANMDNLETLNLAYNNLTGSIPKELGEMNNLTALALAYNNLSGTIPKELGDDSGSTLEGLVLFHNCNLSAPNLEEFINYTEDLSSELGLDHPGVENYDFIINTNTHKCGNLSPIYYLLLN